MGRGGERKEGEWGRRKKRVNGREEGGRHI